MRVVAGRLILILPPCYYYLSNDVRSVDNFGKNTMNMANAKINAT